MESSRTEPNMVRERWAPNTADRFIEFLCFPFYFLVIVSAGQIFHPTTITKERLKNSKKI
jgi:hypothetical protein